MSLKVAFISHSYVESANRRKLAQLAQFTDFRLIAPSSYPTPFGLRVLDREFDSTVPIESYPIRFLSHGCTSTRWFLWSRDMGFSRIKPDIIHVENEQHSWIVCQTLLYRKRFAPRAKVILFFWQNLRAEEQGRKEKLLERLARFNRQFVDFFICGNTDGRKILIDKGVPEDKIEVLPQFGIDPDVFYPYSAERRESLRGGLGILPDEFVIGFVGRFVEEKGLLDLVEATGQLRAASNRVPVLLLTGKGDLESTIQTRCCQLGLKAVVRPARKYHEIPDTMNTMDVLVLPSRSTRFWKEQFGHVLIEAMASGVPVIGSDSGEIPNVIGDAGLVFREGRPEKLSECLRLCSDNKSFRLKLGERGLERASKNYTNDRIAEQTLRIYEQVGHSSHPIYAESNDFGISN